MPRLPDVLDGASRSVDLEQGDFERLLDRRERRQRDRRIRAGALGVIVALVTGAILARSLLLSDGVPADPTPTPTEVLNVWSIVDSGSLPDGAASEATDAAWSPDHGWIAFRVRGEGSPEPGLWIADTASGTPRQVNEGQGWSPWAWSPNSNQLAFVRGTDVALFDVATGATTDLGILEAPEDADEPTVSSLVWSSDGTRIAYDGGAGNRTVYSIDVATGEHTVLVPQPAGAGSITYIDWSPDDEHLAIWYYDDSYIESHQSEFNVYSARALYLAKADGSGLRLVDRIHHGDPNGWEGSPGQNLGTTWSPDGTRFAYSTQVPVSPKWRSVEIQVWTASIDGSAPAEVTSQCCFSDGGTPVWSPDGSQIAFETEPPGDQVHGFLLVQADGTGDPGEMDEITYRSWQGGWFWCVCHG
jgi:Tol biopolymer transport system component